MPTAQPASDQEAREAQQLAQRWIAELGLSEKAQQKWLTRSRKIIKRYKKEGSDREDGKRSFALLWSNTETVRPAIYARPGEPVVTRRFKDEDPVGREASEVIERGLAFSIDQQDLDGVLNDATFDYTLIARGQTWERYVPTYGPEIVPEVVCLQITTDAGAHYKADDGTIYEEAEERDGTFYAKGEPYRPVIFEESVTDYVNFEDFGHGIARTWAETPYVWRRAYMSRADLIKRFGDELGRKVPLDWGPKDKPRTLEDDTLTKKAAIYEIWDKTSRKAIWISKSFNERPLDVRDDPLGLEGFFPCPRPLLGTRANDSLMPVPDYVFYQDQAEEIEDLTTKISELQEALKIVGLYSGESKEQIANLMASKNGTLIPVPAWQKVKDEGGAKGMVEWWPIEQVVKALTACIELRAQLLNDVYQITGIADIMRGQGDPRATATAERLKGQWGPLRIRDRQHEVARFVRDILRIKGEVIAEKFGIDTLKAMTGVKLLTQAEKAQLEQAKAQFEMQVQQAQQMGQQPPPMPDVPEELIELMTKPTWEEVKALMEDNALRQFRIDIETDSTIEPDEAMEKQATVEFIGAVSGLVAQWGPAVQAQPALAPVAAELIKLGVRKYRVGRSVEDIIDRALDEIAKNPPQPEQAQQEQPDQTPIAVAQIDQQTAQIEQQAETERAQMDNALKAQELQLKSGDQQLKLVAMNRDPVPQASF